MKVRTFTLNVLHTLDHTFFHVFQLFEILYDTSTHTNTIDHREHCFFVAWCSSNVTEYLQRVSGEQKEKQDEDLKKHLPNVFC